jgi:hypothetical protein
MPGWKNSVPAAFLGNFIRLFILQKRELHHTKEISVLSFRKYFTIQTVKWHLEDYWQKDKKLHVAED